MSALVRASAVLLVVLPSILPTFLAAQMVGVGTGTVGLHPLSIDDVLANKTIVDVAISPDGEAAAVVIMRAMTVGREHYGVPWSEARLTDVWLVPRWGAVQNLTKGAADGSWHWRPIWSPDSRRIAMLSTRGAEPGVRLYVWDRSSGRSERISDRDVDLNAVIGQNGPITGQLAPPMAWVNATTLVCVFLPSGEHWIQLAAGPGSRRGLDSAWARTERGEAASVGVLDGGVIIPETRRPQGQLASIDVDHLRMTTLVEANVRSVALSPNLRTAAVIAEDGNVLPQPDQPVQWEDDRPFERHYHLGMHRRLGVVAVFGGGPVHWVPELRDPFFAPASRSWTKDGFRFVVMVHSRFDPEEPASPVLVDARGGVIGSGSDSVLQVATAGPGPGPPRGLTLRGWSARTGFAVFTSEPRDGTILWTRGHAETGLRKRLHLNRHLATVEDDAGSESLIQYTGGDGKLYQARLMLPAKYRPGQRYPLVVWAYPGSLVADSLPYRESTIPHEGGEAGFLTHFNLFAVHGYAVLEPSIPPSRGEPIQAMPQFVLPAIDTVVRRGIADSARVGLFGFSHGGIAVYGLLTQTARFRAAIAVSGWADIMHYYTSIGPSFPVSSRFLANEWLLSGFQNFESTNGPDPQYLGLWIGATPWRDPARWMRNNPLYHFDRVQTPLMIVRTDNDFFSMSDGDAAFQALHRLGKRVRYVRYWGEGHGLESPANIRDFWIRTMAWLDQYLRDATCTPLCVGTAP